MSVRVLSSPHMHVTEVTDDYATVIIREEQLHEVAEILICAWEIKNPGKKFRRSKKHPHLEPL